MHMADALLSPEVGLAFWGISAGLVAYSSRKITEENDNASIKTPLMGVMGAFVFAAQMINFSIPGTGSSGHIGGGLLLAILLGPYRAFITLVSVLVLQCLFFADGGLLALGCNIFNLAFFPIFVAYPFIYRKIVGNSLNEGRLAGACVTAAVTGLLMGAFAVVVETVLSGASDLPFKTFVLFMLPIHLLIGIVEGVATWGVLVFVTKTQPNLLTDSANAKMPKAIFACFAIAALALGGFLSWFASSQPDGLEWSISKVTGLEELGGKAQDGIHKISAVIQKKLAFLPDYSFKPAVEGESADKSALHANMGTSLAGITGSFLVLLAATGFGMILRKKKL